MEEKKAKRVKKDLYLGESVFDLQNRDIINRNIKEKLHDAHENQTPLDKYRF